MKSPFTGKEMKKVYETRTWKYRGENFEYIHTSWICEDSGERFTTDETDDAGYMLVTNQYRAKYGIPFTDEILNIRTQYGISAAKIAQILGMGTNQWRHYEAGEVPSVSNGRMIRSIMNPEVFLGLVESSKNELSENEYIKISYNIQRIIAENKNSHAINYETKRIYMTERSAENGYGIQSLQRLKNILIYILNSCGEVFYTKLNKILFYIDFLAYRETGMAITGLTYKALQHGPVPEHWDKIYSNFEEIENESRLYGDYEGVVVRTREKANHTLFTESELKIMEFICNRFKNSSSKEMSTISHNEPGWIENEKLHQRIPFDTAFTLNAV